MIKDALVRYINKMTSIKNSIQTKLTLSFVLLISITSVGVFFFTLASAKQALTDLTKSELREIINVAQSQVSEEKVTALLNLRAVDEGSQKHIELIDFFTKMRVGSEDITNYYVIKKEGETVKFILDDIYPIESAKIEEIYNDPEQTLIDNWGKLSVSEDFYTDKWGTFLSAYTPLKDRDGNVVAMLGIDMKADKLIIKQNFIGGTVYIVIGLSIIIATIMILFFSRTMIRDIKILNEEAMRLTSGKGKFTVSIRRNDEIGELAASFNQMEENVKKSQNILEEKVKERTVELEKAKSGLEEMKTKLEDDVRERTAELEVKLAEVEKLNTYMVGREVRMDELKKKIEDLGGTD